MAAAEPLGRTLRRKMGAANLNRAQTFHIPTLWTMSVSSTASSPPSLRPSYSQSVVSQYSELELESVGSSRHWLSPRPESKQLNTFRSRLERSSTISHNRTCSESLLHPRSRKATVFYHGASFEILNPRESLNVARIVSYIEDVDRASYESLSNQRDSDAPSQCLDYSSGRQSPEIDRPCSLATLRMPTDPIADQYPDSDEDLDLHLQFPSPPLERHHTLPDIYCHQYSPKTPHSLTDARYLEEQDSIAQDQSQHLADNAQRRARVDIVGDAPYRPLPSISERLKHQEDPARLTWRHSFPDSYRILSYYENFHHRSLSQAESAEDGDIGEPGSPVYDDRVDDTECSMTAVATSHTNISLPFNGGPGLIDSPFQRLDGHSTPVIPDIRFMDIAASDHGPRSSPLTLENGLKGGSSAGAWNPQHYTDHNLSSRLTLRDIEPASHPQPKKQSRLSALCGLLRLNSAIRNWRQKKKMPVISQPFFFTHDGSADERYLPSMTTEQHKCMPEASLLIS